MSEVVEQNVDAVVNDAAVNDAVVNDAVVNENVEKNVDAVVNENVEKNVEKNVDIVKRKQYNAQPAKHHGPQHPDLRITQARIKEVEDSIDIILDGRPLTKMNILRVSINAMSTTASMVELPNNVKKMVLIAALNHAIEIGCNNASISELEKEFLLTMVDEVVSQVIDLAHEIASKKLLSMPKDCCMIL
jgi:hypothetical protein